MKKTTVILFACAAIAATLSCCKSAFTPVDYSKWVENPQNGLKQIQAVNGVNFELQYKPQDYIIASENAQPSLSPAFYNERKTKLGDLFYFTLELKSGTQDLLMHNVADDKEYYWRVNYYSLDMQQDIKMIVNNDTLPCIMYQFENTYGVAPFIRMSLAFSGKQRNVISNTDFSILIDDRVFGGGKLLFPFEHKKLNSIPEIELN